MKLDFLKNKIVLVTGGTGSIGSSLVLKLVKSKCKVIRVMSNDENGLYELSREISNKFTINYNLFSSQMKKQKIRFFLGDVRDIKRCHEVTRDVDIVVHAAAIKHVNISEYNPSDAMQTNLQGTKNMVAASIKNNVSKFLFISTDKVVAPTNIMGKSKLLAEKFIINSKKIIKNKKIKISAIRFGNVIGSRGSVVPNFISLLRNKKNINVTSKKMARFVMTPDESIDSILKVLEQMNGFEIFIKRSMKCFKIIDLAEALLTFFRKKGNKTSKIIISQKNIGEKFEEELFLVNEIQKIYMDNDMFIINKKSNIKQNKNIKSINKYRVSNFNFMNQQQIIKLLKNSKLLS
jgi:UDP-N-acetylglucosamine 4,6-dehydratase/5-epimerase